nr:Ig-like domain-containing protein [Lachnospiraceae bacterium]
MNKSAKGMKIKQVVSVFTALFLVITLISPMQVAAKGTVEKVEITSPSTDTVVLKKGKSITLKTKVSVANGASKKVSFKSSNSKVAKVNAKGKVSAKKNGTAKITVTSKDNKKKSASITVKVGTPVTKVSLNKKDTIVSVGKTLTLKASLSPKKPTVKGVTWTTSDSNTATVKNGVVTGVKAGTAKITATAKDGSGKKATVKVKVKKGDTDDSDTSDDSETTDSDVAATGVILNKSSLNLDQGDEVTLKATVTPSKASNKSITWKTSNKSVATVTDGVVKAVAVGTAKITAKTANGKKAECEVTVSALGSVRVSSQTQLNSALSTAKANSSENYVITYHSSESNITISRGDYSNVSLVLNAPNASVVNSAHFADVEIHAIAAHTWTEAEDSLGSNSLRFSSSNAHV